MPATAATIGKMTEQLLIQENAPEPIAIASLTRAGSVATAVTEEEHGYTTGDFVLVAGATPAGYNGTWKVTVTNATTFTYSGAIIGTLATPAPVTGTVTYKSDAQGGQKIGWETLETAPEGIWAGLVSMSGLERLQAQALSAHVDYRFRTRLRTDITARMRAIWTPSWPPGAPAHTLEIHSVTPEDDGRTWMLLDAGEVV